MTFKEFMQRVDQEVINITGEISVHDLADYCFRDAYDDGCDPREIAIEAIRNDDIGAMFADELGI